MNSNNPRLIATFRRQQWINDYAVNSDPLVEFDATEAFLKLPLERIRGFEENNYDSDELAEGLAEKLEHTGPFEVDTDIDEWLEQNGFENGRENLTEQDLALLRQRFNVKEDTR